MSDKPFRCFKCNESFREESLRDKHYSETHFLLDLITIHGFWRHYFQDSLPRNSQTEAMPICSVCGQTFTSTSDLKSHITKTHSKGERYKCSEAGCTKVFATKKSRQEHFNKAHQEKQLICDICKKSFRYKSELRDHMQKHIAVQSHSCPYCPQLYKRFSNVYLHISKKHPEIRRQIKCHICNESFSVERTLQKHVESVHNKNHRRCRFCAKEFTTKNYRAKHEEKCSPKQI